MIFHFSYELPKPVSTALDSETPDLTSEEIRILKRQIRKNAETVNQYIERLDLLVNRERYPHKAIFIEKIRRRLELLIEENDTFRKVLWKHYQSQEVLQQNPQS